MVAAILSTNLLAQEQPAAVTLSTIYSFAGTDGLGPDGSLVMDKTGALYGVTYLGGTLGFGSVFQLIPPAVAGGAWTENVLYSFTGGTDGNHPYGALAINTKGDVYGSTEQGGTVNAACPNGCGVVFELAPPATEGGAWTETVLYSFTGATDGGTPNGALALKGTSLYGTTPIGGTSGHGSVFELAPPTKKGHPWTHSLLYSFAAGTDGADPAAGVVFNKSGALFGTTNGGGVSNAGTVFELAPPAVAGGAWTETVLYSFEDGSDGAFPGAGLVFDTKGALYGTAEFGGAANDGTVFQLKPPAETGSPWTFAVLHAFAGTDGANSYGGLVVTTSGVVYGTTLLGGQYGYGTIFELTPPKKGTTWTETVLYSFSLANDGGNPSAGILLKGTTAYGTTDNGGISAGGTVFELVL
jgi:uncharacterized repeat protein (TIGR03803 family)